MSFPESSPAHWGLRPLLLVLAIVLVPGCNRSSLDGDGDGFTELTNDCDDSDPNVHPDAVEVCYNGKDDNCNGEQDEEGATSGRVWYADLDGDGYGDEGITIQACEQPENYAANKWDCNESDPEINPGAAEVCDYIDNDCDGEVDESTAGDATTWYPDRDGDGYGDDAAAVDACEAPAGYISQPGDCGDLDPLQNPDALEDCRTEADDDCDGTPNGEGAYGCTEFYADLDGDGFPGTAACLCAAEAPYTETEATDCDDERPETYPGAPITRRFALEDCDADIRVDIENSDHELDLGSHTPGYDDRTFPSGVVFLDATGDGLDDLVVGTVLTEPRLLEGPLTAPADLTAPIATLPRDPLVNGHLFLRVLPDQDGDGLEDLLQMVPGSGSTPSLLRAFSSGDRGALDPADALWTLEEDGWVTGARVLPSTAEQPALLLVPPTGEADFRVFELPGSGTVPVDLGTVIDPLVTGEAVMPALRTDFDGDGVDELVLEQDTTGFLTRHRWDGGGAVYRPQTALAIMEPYAADTPLDLEAVHVVYGWYTFGRNGGVVVRDVDGDGRPDLLGAESSNLLATQSGAVWVFTAESLYARERPYTLMTEADAIYSAAEGDTITTLREAADLDGDGDNAILAVGWYGEHWLIDRLPLGHHALETFARPFGTAVSLDAYGDANGDGIDDLTLFDGTQTLNFFWGELP